MKRLVTIDIRRRFAAGEIIWTPNEFLDKGKCLRPIQMAKAPRPWKHETCYCYEVTKDAVIAADKYLSSLNPYAIGGKVINQILSVQELSNGVSYSSYGVIVYILPNGEIQTYPSNVKCSKCEKLLTCYKRYTVYQPDVLIITPCL